jgi:hypothetical protein
MCIIEIYCQFKAVYCGGVNTEVIIQCVDREARIVHLSALEVAVHAPSLHAPHRGL